MAGWVGSGPMSGMMPCRERGKCRARRLSGRAMTFQSNRVSA